MPGNPGLMNRRLTVQVRTLSRDSAGGRVQTWADSYDVWAQELKPRATEPVVSEAERTVDERQFRIRWRSDISEDTHRILYRLRFFDIVGIVEEGIRDRLLLTCRAVKTLTT